MRSVRLVPLVALLFQPMLDPEAGLLDWVAVATMLAIFLPLHLAGYRASGNQPMLLIVGAMAVLGVAGSLVNGGASVFVIYAQPRLRRTSSQRASQSGPSLPWSPCSPSSSPSRRSRSPGESRFWRQP